MSGVSARPNTSSLAEVLDRILDKGVIVDLWIRVSLVGVEMITVELRVVTGSVDTFLHYAREITGIERAEGSDANGTGGSTPGPSNGTMSTVDG